MVSELLETGWSGDCGRTTLSVPTRTLGGVVFAETISEMKLAVMPMAAIKEQAWRIRDTLKLAPRAPSGPAMMRWMSFAGFRGKSGRNWRAVVDIRSEVLESTRRSVARKCK